MSPGTMPLRSEEDGFTLIELLVVCAIIGILAAIGIAAFLSQRDKAYAGSAKYDVRSAELALEVYEKDHDTYDATPADLVSIEPTLSDARALSVTGDDSRFTVSVKSKSPEATTFTLERKADGTTVRTCTQNDRECPDGTW